MPLTEYESDNGVAQANVRASERIRLHSTLHVFQTMGGFCFKRKIFQRERQLRRWKCNTNEYKRRRFFSVNFTH